MSDKIPLNNEKKYASVLTFKQVEIKVYRKMMQLKLKDPLVPL